MELFFSICSLPIACLQHRGKNKIEEPSTCLGRDCPFKIHCDRLTGLLKLMAVCPPSHPLSLQSGSCYCTQSIPRFLESSDGHQDNHDGMLEASSVVTSLFLSFSLSLSTHTHKSPPCLFSTHTHTHT